MKLLSAGDGQYFNAAAHRRPRRQEKGRVFEHTVSDLSTFSHQVMAFVEDAEKLLLAVLNTPDETPRTDLPGPAACLARFRRPRFQGRQV
jgi:hypothetical protein